MLFKGALILILGLVAIQVFSSKVPFGILDDAKAELETLRATILGAIIVADSDLSDYYVNLQIYGQTTENSASVTIENEEATINRELQTLKDLANSAKVNISYCLQGRENYLENLPATITDELIDCVDRVYEEGSRIVSEYSYIIDVTINTVDALNFQLASCQPDSEECISAIVKQIELATEKVPQDIQVEILKAGEFFDELKVLVNNCGDLKVSQYVSSVNTILKDVTKCVDALLG